MDENIGKVCKINMDKVENYYKKKLGSSNNNLLDQYCTCPAESNIVITVDEVTKAIKSTSYDTSPGPDKVLARTIKELQCAEILKTIIDIMLKTSQVPDVLHEGRTILIYKGGAEEDISNWRPITIYSVVRRIIKKVLDQKLQEEIDLNCYQRGFIAGLQGCHINSKILNACLKDSKTKGKDCIICFLDVSKAFDNIGHQHIAKSLRHIWST